jgi:glycoside/pentoside/hexuronide:cation symporter, GPH family
LGLAIALVLQSLDWAGYVAPSPDLPAPVQSEAVLFAIRCAIGPLPTIALLLGMVCTFFYPITREKHAEIRLRLSERKSAQG